MLEIIREMRYNRKQKEMGEKCMTTKQIVAIIMCAVLLLTVVIAAIVIGRLSPILNVLLGGGATESTNPSESSSSTEQCHEHDFAIQVESVPAECGKDGYMIWECQCGERKMDTVEALQHQYGAGKKVAPTCDVTGRIEYTCTLCKYVKVEETGEPALGHNYSNQLLTVEPTSNEPGYIEYSCTNTNCTSTKRELGEKALGHDMSEWEIFEDPKEGQLGKEKRFCQREGCNSTETRDTPMVVDLEEIKQTGNVFSIDFNAKKMDGQMVAVYTSYVTDYSGKLTKGDFDMEGTRLTIKGRPIAAGESLEVDEEGNVKVPGT